MEDFEFKTKRKVFNDIRDLNANLKKNKVVNKKREVAHLDAIFGAVEKVSDFLKSNPEEINVIYDGMSLLDIAVMFNHIDLVKHLILNGAKINNSLDENGISLNKNSTLNHAILNKASFDIIKILVDSGADIESKTVSGHTPLLLAIENLDFNLIKYLINKGADTTAKLSNGSTAENLIMKLDDQHINEYFLIKKEYLESKKK